jgi:hypothetical protein
MCRPSGEVSTSSTGGGEGSRAGRRTFLKVAGSGLVFSSALGAATMAPAAAISPKKRAYVIVVDGCRPDEIDSAITPTLRGLRDGGLRFPRASSMPIMETIPNHVMMMTGVRPDRSGVPANSFFDAKSKVVRDMDRASDIRYRTIIEQLNASGRTTGTVLSKAYLYGVFGARATHRWEPAPQLPLTNHSPDQFTMTAAIDMVEHFDPNLVFINLGDIDRFGHADITGTTLKLARQTALADTDQQVKRFVDMLKSSGRWEHSVVIVLADHSMDWSLPDHYISLSGALAGDPLLAGKVEIAQNGGAELLYWRGAADKRAAAITRMRAIATATEGVLEAHDRANTPWLRLGARGGEVVVFCRAGWRFTDPNQSSNPIPGNHGHPATRPIPFFISGGHPIVPRNHRSAANARTIDVTPTLGRFFGITAPKGSWDGTARL